MRKDKNLDELFRDKLLNYEQEPPAYLLENILAGVAGARRNRKIVFWRIAGVAAALLLAFVAGWQFNIRNGQDIKQPVSVSQQTAPEVSPDVKTQLENAMSDNYQQVPANAQLAELVTESKVVKNNSISTIKTSKSERIILPAETLTVAANTESNLLKPLKSLFGLIDQKNEPIADLRQAQKSEKMLIDINEKTIDQQIMEQNQQSMLTENQAKGKAKWSVGAQVSPEYNVSRSSHSQAYASNMVSASANPVDLGGGISVEYKKGKRWSLQSGVYYSGMGQSSGNSSYSNRYANALADFASNLGEEYFNAPVNVDAITSKMMLNSTAGVIQFSSVPAGLVLGTNLEDKTLAASAVVISDTRFIQNFEYIEIPLYVRYTLLDSKFDVEMMGGFSSNLLVGNETYMETSVGKNLVGSTKDMETMNYSGTLGIGLKYGLSKRINLNVEPRVKYYLNSLNSNSSVTYKPYTIGVFTGLSYEF